VAASFDRNNNRLSIYIDGEKSGIFNTRGKMFAINGTDLFIGRNKWPQKASDHVSSDYPDGTLLRYVHYYNDEEGWQDLQFFSAPVTKQEDNIELNAITIANIEGDLYEMDWTNGIPKSQIDHPTIVKINFKSEYKVMVIFPKEVDGIDAWGDIERATPEIHFAGPWNHWPVSQMPNDGRSE